MKKLKKLLFKTTGSAAGGKTAAQKNQQLQFNNFSSLAQAHEQLINETAGKKLIKQNGLRIKLLTRLQGTPPAEAYHIVGALSETESLEGDVCEFGVAQGEASALIGNEIREQKKILHLFDSFEGLPKPTEHDTLKDDIFSLGNMEAYSGTMSCPENMVTSRLEAISFPENRYMIHKGFIEKLIKTDEKMPARVSFAYVDFDFYEPIKIILNYLHGVTPCSAIIIVDDYDFFSTGVKKAVDEFVSEHNAHNELYSIRIPDKQYGHFAILTKKS